MIENNRENVHSWILDHRSDVFQMAFLQSLQLMALLLACTPLDLGRDKRISLLTALGSLFRHAHSRLGIRLGNKKETICVLIGICQRLPLLSSEVLTRAAFQVMISSLVCIDQTNRNNLMTHRKKKTKKVWHKCSCSNAIVQSDGIPTKGRG